MRSARPELIVPIRDRRQHRRILTVRNFRNFILLALVVFGAISIYSELRRPSRDEYGRLFGREVQRVPEVTPNITQPVIEAQPVPDQESADPLLLESAAREQYLGVTELPQQPVQASTMPVSDAPRITPNTEVAIVGGADGVSIVKTESGSSLPKLGGGFGKEQ